MVVALGYMCILTLLEGLWSIYINTTVGQYFTTKISATLAGDISNLLAMTVQELSFELTKASLAACLIVGLVEQAFIIRRYLYDGRGILCHVVWS